MTEENPKSSKPIDRQEEIFKGFGCQEGYPAPRHPHTKVPEHTVALSSQVKRFCYPPPIKSIPHSQDNSKR
jgi:hypothetical protein